jgi:hypothetical protein
MERTENRSKVVSDANQQSEGDSRHTAWRRTRKGREGGVRIERQQEEGREGEIEG